MGYCIENESIEKPLVCTIQFYIIFIIYWENCCSIAAKSQINWSEYRINMHASKSINQFCNRTIWIKKKKSTQNMRISAFTYPIFFPSILHSIFDMIDDIFANWNKLIAFDKNITLFQTLWTIELESYHANEANTSLLNCTQKIDFNSQCKVKRQ